MKNKEENVNCGISLGEAVYELLESQEKRGRRGKKLFKEIMAENFPNLRRDLYLLVIKLIYHPKISIQGDLLQDKM